VACALEATPADIIIAEMQAITARDSLVMTTPLDEPPRRHQAWLAEVTRQSLFFGQP
jgi:hypothetical protein